MPTLNIICLFEKNNTFLRFCLCNFANDTVESDCPVQIFRKMMKYLKITLLVLLFFLEILKKRKKSSEKKRKKKLWKKIKKKKKALKMTSQLVIFRAFLFIFFRPLDPRSEKKFP